MSNNNQNKSVNNKTETNKTEQSSEFIFVFEADKKYYSHLDDIEKTDKKKVTIHPVYYYGYQGNMNIEDVYYSKKHEKYTTKNKDGTWLEVIYEYPDSLFPIESDKLLVHKKQIYCCDRCLLYGIMGSEPETIPVHLKKK